MSELSRRGVLAGILGIGIATGLSGCGLGENKKYLGDAAIASRQSGLPKSGKTEYVNLTANLAEIDFGGITAKTWAYGNSVPGKILRVNKGDRLKVNFKNALPTGSSVHWHGLAIRNDMDGVPGVTSPEVTANGSFRYDFTVPDSGTYWFHPHSGTQLDRGLYAPLIVDDPQEVVKYDSEWIVMLDDWSDGISKNPDEIFSSLLDGTGVSSDMGGMGTMHDMNSMDGGDVSYPMYLINGRPQNDPEVLTAKPGERIRIRIINASADTIFKVALAQHQMTITHTDGFPVSNYETMALLIGMGERYDVLVTVKDGVFPLVAEAYGKSQIARAIIRSGSGSIPAASFKPSEFDSIPLTANLLESTESVRLLPRKVDRTQDLILSGSMKPYKWMINGRTYAETDALSVKLNELGRLRIQNQSMMSHPIHLHGHTFQLGAAGGLGARKDTVLVPPMGGIEVDFAATNPGKWMIHCHNAYHAEAGMMTRLEYVA